MISVNNLHKTYGGHTALGGVDFEISRGEFVLLFGPNGAGKTTLLKILTTILSPTKGDVSVNDTPVTQNSNEIRTQIGFVSHDPFLYENLSALENLVFFAGLYNVAEAENRAKELLETLQLSSRENELVRNYSKGMKQRVAFARALIHSPDIIFLDEPLSGLDLIGASIITDILGEYKSQGKTILMSTHNLDDCAGLADRIIVLVSGKIRLTTTERDREIFKNKYIEIIKGIQ